MKNLLTALLIVACSASLASDAQYVYKTNKSKDEIAAAIASVIGGATKVTQVEGNPTSGIVIRTKLECSQGIWGFGGTVTEGNVVIEYRNLRYRISFKDFVGQDLTHCSSTFAAAAARIQTAIDEYKSF